MAASGKEQMVISIQESGRLIELKSGAKLRAETIQTNICKQLGIDCEMKAANGGLHFVCSAKQERIAFVFAYCLRPIACSGS